MIKISYSLLELKLRNLGLSIYEAKLYFSLLLCNSTMKEFSEDAQIPYQKYLLYYVKSRK
ncbi:helix-turn-helix domain-containing protein [Saccharolobus sp.]|uniref:helix-turn-helix domain-containing protein n=1 Tax=Saccharolobus sp. TaxID=2100761 RepID=UPI0031755598